GGKHFFGVVVDNGEHPLQAGAVELGDEPEHLFDLLPHPWVGGSPELVDDRFDTVADHPQVHLLRSPRRTQISGMPVGECTFFSTFPLPRYMCTPHGRQGSKLRTVRMMSMPLKFSTLFSSKIGVFITASS